MIFSLRDLLDLVLIAPKLLKKIYSSTRPEPDLLPLTVSDEQAEFEGRIAAVQELVDRRNRPATVEAVHELKVLDIEVLDPESEMNFVSLVPAYSTIEGSSPDITVLTVRVDLRVINNDLSHTSIRLIDARIVGAVARADMTPNDAEWVDQRHRRIEGRSWQDFALQVDRVYDGIISFEDARASVEIFVLAAGVGEVTKRLPPALFI